METVKRWLFNFLLIAVLCCTGIYAGVVNMSHKATLSALEDQIGSLTSQINIAKNNATRDTSSIVLQETGFDKKRVETDNKVMDGIFSRLLNWADYDEYSAVREEMLAERSEIFSEDFFEQFFPKLHSYETDDGKTVWQVADYGATANMSYSGIDAIDAYVMSIDDDVYTYLTEVVVTSSINDVCGRGICMFTYSVTGDGTVFDLKGYSVV